MSAFSAAAAVKHDSSLHVCLTFLPLLSGLWVLASVRNLYTTLYAVCVLHPKLLETAEKKDVCLKRRDPHLN